jgi:hypothetical protein
MESPCAGSPSVACQRHAQRGGAEAEPAEESGARHSSRRLRECREQVLCLLSELSVAFDHNGWERDLRLVNLAQQSSGWFPTAAGAERFCRSRWSRSYLSRARQQEQSPLWRPWRGSAKADLWLLAVNT